MPYTTRRRGFGDVPSCPAGTTFANGICIPPGWGSQPAGHGDLLDAQPQTFTPSLNDTLQPPQPVMPITSGPLPPVTQPTTPANPPATNYQPAPGSAATFDPQHPILPLPATTQPSVLPAPAFDLSFLTQSNWTGGLLPNWALLAGAAGLFFFRR